jgi:LPS export ABC transporter permease LptG/LPS export ABC transporter permease LptF
MGLLGRTIFREALWATLLGTLLFTFVLFLRGASQLFELLVRSSAEPATVAYLFALALPPALVYTIPLGLLAGLLVSLSRMSSDGEITAMRAAGLPGRRVATPVISLALISVAVTAACSLWLTPWSYRETYRVGQDLAAEQLTAEIEPRVFQEQFPNAILFVGDVQSGTVVRWKNVFLADLRPPTDRQSGFAAAADSPRITVAREAIAVPDSARNRIQLSMIDASSHEAGGNPADYYNTSFRRLEQTVEAEKPREIENRPTKALDTGPLFLEARSSLEARIELHRRLALPPSCLLLALIGIPLGISSRKAGKSAAVVTTAFLALLYHTVQISLIGLAKQGTLPVEVAVWTPNAVLAVAGFILLVRLERPGDRDITGAAGRWVGTGYRSLLGLLALANRGKRASGRSWRLQILPQVLDTYILSSFLLYFFLFLVSFVLMTEVYTFFELLSHIIKNQIPMSRVTTYLFYLAPMLIYDSTSVSALVAVLVTFGLMAKRNEIVAFKSCGISLHRLAVPVALASFLLSVSLFAFDYYYVPEANRRQDAIRAEIKGNPVQTFQRPQRPWIRGEGSRIYHYKYFDSARSEMAGVSVYELDPGSFRLLRHISAERASWSPPLKTWVFENGWRRDLAGKSSRPFETFQATTFPELNEPPSYFLKEVKQDKQMNFRELADYVAELRQSGFDTVQLRIQYYKKFSVPLFVLILSMISVPFAFLTGSRGALGGVAASFGIAIVYWSVNLLFEQVGNINQLPPAAAAWAPNAMFSLAGVYLLARMRT